MENNYLTKTKVSKSNNGKGKSFTYSTVIPKMIITKFGLDKGKNLYWNIENGNIIITPELPEEASIQAGYDILNDFIVNGNNHYGTYATNIISQLKSKKSNEDKIETIVSEYKRLQQDKDKDEFKKVVLYLLDYPLDIQNQYEILQEVYEEITKD